MYLLQVELLPKLLQFGVFHCTLIRFFDVLENLVSSDGACNQEPGLFYMLIRFHVVSKNLN